MHSEEEKSASTLTFPTGPNNDSQLAFVFTCDPEEMLSIFQSIAIEQSFDMIERQGCYATAVKKIQKKKSIMNFINCCSWFRTQRFTAVKIVLSKHTKKGSFKDTFIAEVKGLVGVHEDIENFVTSFQKTITKLGIISPQSKLMLTQTTQLPIDPTQYQNPYYLEACSHHLINKLILNSEYNISDNLTKMINDYLNTFRNVEESSNLLPLPMKNSISIVTEVSEQLDQLLRQLKYPLEILPFSRITVQNYIFNKLESQLYSIYRFKNIKTQKLFHEKRTKILEAYTIRDILEQVCLNKKFWSVNPDKIDIVLPKKQAKEEIYFTCVCKELEKMVFTNSPRQKIKYCQMAYTELKSHFYDFTKRKQQLASMEDIIPVLIVIVLFLEIGEMRSQFDVMLDFANFDPNQMQAEKRLLINLSESYNYINRDWVLK